MDLIIKEKLDTNTDNTIKTHDFIEKIVKISIKPSYRMISLDV